MISRRHALAAALALSVLSAPSAMAEPTIGLAERRAIAAYRQDRYPAQEKAIQEAAGFAVPVEVAWDDLTLPGDAKYYSDPDYFEKTIFEPLAAGLKEVAKDKMGRPTCGPRRRRRAATPWPRSSRPSASASTRTPRRPRTTPSASRSTAGSST